MRFYADLHIHSRYSIATSKLLIPSWLDFWARVKGISLLGTGDCIHPLWLETLEEELEPLEEGLFTIKQDKLLKDTGQPFPLPPGTTHPRFCLTTEISTIFKRDGRVRKSHSLILLSSLNAAKRLQAALEKTGNIRSDGRPILGLDVKHLLGTVLECDPQGMLIPAHIWTPWFSMLGSKSGFDTAEECFEDLTRYITAVETGLSSDPAMNWCCSFLDKFQLISNSDAHSPEKLGRNATVFDMEDSPSFPLLMKALKTGDGLAGTVDLFPQEGKYHFDGHRKCGIRFSPLETLQHEGICPECGRPVTKGVLYRVAELADRFDPLEAPDRRPSFPLVPLPELLAAILGVGPGSKRVKNAYISLIGRLGPELPLLLDMQPEALEEAGEAALARMVTNIRQRRITLNPGFDGEFGTIIAAPGGITPDGGPALFSEEIRETEEQPLISFDIAAFQLLNRKKKMSAQIPELPETKAAEPAALYLNPAQEEAVAHNIGPCRIIAGPGSGKTRVLAEFIRRRIREGTPPERILALSFSNRAAGELAERVADFPGVRVLTFHKLGLSILEEEHEHTGRTLPFTLLPEEEAAGLVKTELPRKTLHSLIQSKLLDETPDNTEAAERYRELLSSWNAFDLTDLISVPLKILRTDDPIRKKWRSRFDWILVDEAQDINRSQYNLLKELCRGSSPNTVLVGDPDQAIYGFRGADAGLMDLFCKDFPGTSTIRLDRSYRCPNNVLEAAGGILKNRTTLHGGETGVEVAIRECSTARSEAEWIARTVEKMLGGVRSFSRESGISDGEGGTESLGDFAVLCRTKAQFPALLEAFGNHGISTSCRLRETNDDGKKLLALLRHIANPALPLSEELGKAIPEELPDDAEKLLTVLEACFPEIASEAIDRIKKRVRPEESPAEFLQRLTLEQEQDSFDPRAEAVSLITMHAAKGLEFKNVFIPGCTGKIMPFTLYGDKTEEKLLEEERLLFVAMTRTKERLFISWPKKLKTGGLDAGGSPSPFLARIRESLLTRDREEARSIKDSGQQELGF